MSTFLHGLSIKNYRGIGSEEQQIFPLSSINLFIGSNNSGKSSFLSFIDENISDLTITTSSYQRSKKQINIRHTDIPLGGHKHQMSFRLGISPNVLLSELKRYLQKKQPNLSFKDSDIEKALYALGESIIWLSLNTQDHSLVENDGITGLVKPPVSAENAIYHLWRLLSPHRSGGSINDWMNGIVELLIGLPCLQLPNVAYIPAIRQIGTKGEEYQDMSGKGLIDKLAEIQHPSLQERDKLEDFQAINSFVRTVTGDQEAELEIPHDREHILVHMNNRLLPLSSLGTGIHEIIMLAAFCTLSKNQIVCIEEPEIHLHPTLQRKLMAYLAAKTSNQYFIATHSAVLIDTPGATTFHVALDQKGHTTVKSASTPSERYAICTDLGYKASDIVQANSVIWVEGPSDRIYINHWIRTLAPSLIEGQHYSIMFYGGRLLNHLSADDNEVDDFIKLQRLNRNLAIIIDSDKTSPYSRINSTKKRVISELTASKGVAWITKGKEIENYLSEETLRTALKTVYPAKFSHPCHTGAYEYVLPFHNKPSRRKDHKPTTVSPDKIKIAKAVSMLPANFSILDLKERTEELIRMIRKANP